MLRVSLRVSAKHAFELRGALRAILFCRYLISKIKDALPHCESACAFLRNALLNKRLRASRVDKAHFVRSADAGSFARDYSLALPACYARDVLHPSSYKARLLCERVPLKSANATEKPQKKLQKTITHPIPAAPPPQSPHTPHPQPHLPSPHAIYAEKPPHIS